MFFYLNWNVFHVIGACKGTSLTEFLSLHVNYILIDAFFSEILVAAGIFRVIDTILGQTK